MWNDIQIQTNMNNKSFSITAEESKQIDKEYEIAEILINLRKALSEVGDVKLSEAIEELSGKTRFPIQFNTYLDNCYGQV